MTGLNLEPRTARIEINYSTLNLMPTASLRFRYKLDGFDSDWQESEQRRQALYTNLPPGSYRFRVANSNGDGVWEEADQPLPFSIKRAFYQTYLFYVLCLTSIVGAITVGWRLRLRMIHKRFRSVLGERVRVAQALHDTLLQSLVAVALDFDDISSQLGSSHDGLREQVTSMREKVEHYIRDTRLSIWNLRSESLESNSLVEALRKGGEMVASGSRVTFQCVERGTRVKVTPEIEEQLLRIGQEALVNAVRHADAATIKTELLYEDAQLRLLVTDDGRGFDLAHTKSVEHNHWGLATMRERALRIDAQFSVHTVEGIGTTVEVIVPTHQG
jgi:signal transduction histidine kinase